MSGPHTSSSRMRIGIALAVTAGICWGTMAVFAQILLSGYSFTVRDLTSLRLVGAGVLLLLASALFEKKSLLFIFKDRKLLRDIAIYGLGLFAIQYTFFQAINVSNAGTAALMVGFGPLFIILYSFFFKGRIPAVTEIGSFFLAFCGIALIVTKGKFDSLDFSLGGALWGLASAAFGAFCTVQPKSAIEKAGVSIVVGAGMVTGGAAACLIFNPFAMQAEWSLISAVCYAFIVLFGTVAAFWCYLKSTEYIPAAFSAILGAFEPLTALVLGVLIAGTVFNGWEYAGAALILCALILLSRSRL